MTFHVDNLRLEVETPTTGLNNLIANPSGEKGAWGWLTPVSNTSLDSDYDVTLGNYLTFYTGVSQAAYMTSEFLAVTAGMTVAGRFEMIFGQSGYLVKARWEYYNSSKVLLSSGGQTTFPTTAATNFVPPATTPANTAFVKLRLDLYNSTSGNPAANGWFSYRQAMVTTSATSTFGATRTNLVKNPSFEIDLSSMDGVNLTRSTTVGGYSDSAAGRVEASYAGQDAYVGTLAQIPITGGKTYTFQVRTRAATTARTVKLTYQWYDVNGDYLSGGISAGTINAVGSWTRKTYTSTAPSKARFCRVYANAYNCASGERHYADAFMLEEGSTAGTYFDGSSSTTGKTYAWAGTAHNSTSTETTSNATFDYAEPNAWTNILGPTHEIRVSRGGLDVGLLSAEILDAALDPADTTLVRPGKKIRLQALVDDVVWQSVYEGKITNAQVTYPRTTSGTRTRISLTASDNVAHLANQTESRGVYNVTDLPYILEGKGVPWSVNDSGNQVTTTPTIVSMNDSASVLDQIAITRDSISAYAWVDRSNVLNAKTRALMPTTPVYVFTDTPAAGEFSYSDIDVNFDTDACINDISVNWLRYNAGTGKTESIGYGPYKDQASIDTWGAHTAEFTLHGPTESTTVVSNFANGVLAQNATPTIRAQSLVTPVRNDAEIKVAANLDLYMPVTVKYSTKVNRTLRITGIEHQISPEKWSVVLTFDAPGSVAAPQETPDPGTYYGDVLPFSSRFRANAQTFTDSVQAVVTWGSSVKTQGITYNTAGNWVVLKPGRYLITAHLGWVTNATGRRVLFVYVNGVSVARVAIPGSAFTGGPTGTVSKQVYLNAGDVVEIQAVQVSGANLDTTIGEENASAQISWIGD